MDTSNVIICPHCHSKARHSSHDVFFKNSGEIEKLEGTVLLRCLTCDEVSICKNGRIVHPLGASAPPPSEGLSLTIRQDYEEAARILDISPRGAAALLRLVLQKLCKELGADQDTINDAIATLVSHGLPEEVQMAMDYVRVIGNNAVHPGVIDISDDAKTAGVLFELINIVSDIMITQPHKIKTLYDSLPQKYRDEIARRKPKK